MASFFFGVGEAKALLKTGKLTSNTARILAGIPANVSKLLAALPGKLKKLQNNVLAYVISANTYVEVARFSDEGSILIDKWLDTGEEIVGRVGDIHINDEFTDALELIKRGNGALGWRLAFKEGLERNAEIVNKYFIEVLESSPPYKISTKVKDIDLEIGKTFFVVENKFQQFPGSWGSTFKVSSINELRNKLAVLKSWKKVRVLDDGRIDGLVVREYEVIEKIPARDGYVRRQIDVDGSIYEGGAQQYEFLVKGNELKQRLNLISETPIN